MRDVKMANTTCAFYFFLLAIKYFDFSGCNRCKNSLAEMKRTGSPRPSLLLINRDPFLLSFNVTH